MSLKIDINVVLGEERLRAGELIFNSGDESHVAPMAFRYDDAWITSGFALGSDLPLRSGIHFPIADAAEVDPVLCARNGGFGFVRDHAPGKWVQSLYLQARLIGLKTDFDERELTSWHLWTFAGHPSERFSALQLPVNGGFFREFRAPSLVNERTSQQPKFLRNLTAALETASSNGSFRTPELLEMLLMGAVDMGGESPKCLVELDKADAVPWVVRCTGPKDPFNRAVWTAVARKLASDCGLDVVDGMLLGSKLYAEKRFDRDADGKPLFCLSAASLVRRDKTQARLLKPMAMSYLDIADILNVHGSRPTADLRELFIRLLFNTLTGNNRDRLDQFWFARQDGGWVLLPMYAPCAQPPFFSTRLLSTPVRAGVNMADVETAVSVARYFGISQRQAKELRLLFAHLLSGWRSAAESVGADLAEIGRMDGAFG